MKNRYFRRILTFMLAMAIVFSFSACSNSSNANSNTSSATGSAKSTGDVKVIKFMHRFPDEPFNSYINKKVKEYEASHAGIQIQVTSAQNDAYKEKIKVVIGTDNGPDVFYSWIGEFTNRFIRQGLIYDLTDAYNSDKAWSSSMIKSQMDCFYTDGKLYGAPFRLDGKTFFYNKEIFTKLGLKTPTTWDEFISVCKKIKENNIIPIAYGNQDKWPSAHYIGALNAALVPSDVRKKDFDPKTGAFTDANYVKALDYYKQLIPFFNDSVNGTKHDISRALFTSGKAAIFFGELVEIPNVATENSKLDYGMFAFPTINDGNGDQGLLVGAPEGFVMSAKCKYPKETIEFLKYITTCKDEASSIGWFNGTYGQTDGLNNAHLTDAYNVIVKAKGLENWLDSNLYSTVCNEYLSAVSDFTNGDITSSQAMQKIQKAAKGAQTEVSK